MSDLDYIRSCFPFDFKKQDNFCNELYKNIEDATKKLIDTNKKYDYLKREILYNAFNVLRNKMVVNVNNIMFFENGQQIIIDFDVFSLNSGIIKEKKITNLELAY